MVLCCMSSVALMGRRLCCCMPLPCPQPTLTALRSNSLEKVDSLTIFAANGSPVLSLFNSNYVTWESHWKNGAIWSSPPGCSQNLILTIKTTLRQSYIFTSMPWFVAGSSFLVCVLLLRNSTCHTMVSLRLMTQSEPASSSWILICSYRRDGVRRSCATISLTPRWRPFECNYGDFSIKTKWDDLSRIMEFALIWF